MTNYFVNCQDINEIKKTYRNLAMENHPDRGGDTATMQKINEQYHNALNGKHETKFTGDDGKEYTYWYNQQKEQSIIDKLDELIALNLSDGSEIWLIGFWIWILDTDKELDYDKLKSAKCRWHSKRKCMYWKPAGKRRSRYNKDASLEDLGHKYGLEIAHKVNKEKEQSSQMRITA